MRKFLVFLLPVFFSTFFLFSNEVSAAEVLPIKSGKSIYGYEYSLGSQVDLVERDWTSNKILIPKSSNKVDMANLYAVWFYPKVKKENFQTVKFNGIDVSFYSKVDLPLPHFIPGITDDICNAIGVQGFAGSWNQKVENCSVYSSLVSDTSIIHINFDLTISSVNNQSFSLGDNFNIYVGNGLSINSRKSLANYVNCVNNSFCLESPIQNNVMANDIVLRGIDYYASATDALNQQILNQEKEQTNALKQQTQQQKDQYDRNKAEEQNRENQGKDSSNQLKGLFNIQAINPFSAIFNLFQPQNSCVRIPIISSWLRISNLQICPWFPATVRNTLTPVFGVSSIMVLFGFVVRWLRKDEA